MDQSVEMLLQTLDTLHLAETTLVYFVSDHGGHLEAVGSDGQRTGGYNGLYKGIDLRFIYTRKYTIFTSYVNNFFYSSYSYNLLK